MEIPITILSDEKGYYDRECPNENCLYQFKIMMKDWKEKCSDDEIHCPMCGHIDSSDKWWTEQQLQEMQDIAVSWATDYIGQELDKAFKGLERSTRGNKFCKITYKPGRRTTFINNPIGALDEWETDITCENCGTRYSVIGSAYFCPCCGYNSAIGSFNESLDNTEKMLESLPLMKEMFTEQYGRDKAETMSRSMLESTIGDIVSAFQKFAGCLYESITGKTVRVNDFQIVEKGSKLFEDISGKGYGEWLSTSEIATLNMFFQKRHVLEHNNGMVDQKYIEKSGDAEYTEGQRLVIHKEDVRKLLELIRKLATGLLAIREVDI